MKIKYLQVLGFNDTKFYTSFVKTINENDAFDNSQFLFVTFYKEVYDEIKKYDNVKLINKRSIYYYFIHSKWIFLHPNYMSKVKFCILPNYIAKKIIWRTWGHDIRPLNDKKQEKLVVKGCRNIINWLYVKKVRKIRGFGIANDIDIVNIENVFRKSFDYFYIGYGGYKDKGLVLRRLEKNVKSNELKKDNYKVLLGHNAGRAENHILNLKRLSKFKDNNIKIIMPLAYSVEEGYLKEVKRCAIDIFGNNKVEFIEHFMEYADYAKLIASVDIAIMDQEFSNGLGNLSLLMYFGKKIYINRNGNVAQSFNKNGIKCCYTDDISRIEFDDFINYEGDEKAYEVYLRSSSLVNPHLCIENLKETINRLN